MVKKMSGNSLIFSIVYLIFKCCLIRQRPAPLGTGSLRKLIDSEELLSPKDHRLYRRIVGQLLWLSSIRPDIQFTVKDCHVV